MTANNPSLGTYRLPYIHGPRYERDDIGLYIAFKINETKSIQVHAQAFDFTNHALNAFIQYDSTNTSTAGYTQTKLGSRTIQLAMKIFF